MSTNVPSFLHNFVMAKLATTSMRVKPNHTSMERGRASIAQRSYKALTLMTDCSLHPVTYNSVT